MSFPASLTARTVKGRFVTHPDGVPAKGYVRIVLNDFMQGPVDDTFVAPFERIFTLVDGQFSTMLPATNDPQWSSSFYRVYITTMKFDHPRPFSENDPDAFTILKARLEVPYDSNLPIDLADVLNVPAGSPGSIYIVTSQRGVPGGIATLGSDGKVTPTQLPVGSGGDVEWDDIQNKPAIFPHDEVTWDEVTGKPDIGDGGDVDWTDILNKPTTFTPAAHTHTESDVTGLTADLAAKASTTALASGLAGKANTSHTHTESDVTGLTADLAAKANTSDVGTALALKADSSALATKADLASPTFTGTVGGITKSMVGLANVDNISDANKPVSIAQQTALDLKANLASPTFSGIVSGVTAAMVGLGNVTNTADSAKPVSTAQQTALDLKAPLASPTFTGTVGGVTKSMVGLGSVDNTADTAKPVSTAQQTALDLKAPLASPTFTGTVSGISKTMVGLGNVDNTADTAKPVSTTQQTALDLKAPLASPTFTGTPAAPTPTAGDSTTKIATTAFVTAVDILKAPIASPSFTGTPLAPTAAAGTNTTQIATTAFVQAYTAKVLILGPDNGSNPVPGGTPAGTLIVRTT